MSDTYTPLDFGVDPSNEEICSDGSGQSKTAVIRTSDRIAFKRCRRRWGWSSHLRGNLGTKESSGPLWFGTGMHFALEDFHGYRTYGTPASAFAAYCDACYRNRSKVQTPGDYHELRDLGIGMMTYYEQWLSERDPLK